ncbi:hypothetical protein [Tropicibacter naphthalenivorans]|uniref:hypothetical protein n=1 Tax=Tropicibacter naphthalenivorans TaxID=441103 RepID=UPI0009FAA0F3|nr:hypothetical protein [Tropicibacter naphthalenivorans]
MLEDVHFKIDFDMLVVANQIAREKDISVGQLLRNLLSAEISRRKNARPPNRADEQLLAPLRARLAPIFAAANDWNQLENDLRNVGFAIRPAGGGLALHRHPSGERLCKASELGFSYSRLVERYQSGFPGHAHTWIAERFASSPHKCEGPPGEDVIED